MAAPVDGNRRLTNWEAAAYGLPSATLAALALPLLLYLPPFYAEEMGLGLATVGTVFALTRLWDVITDPVLGYVSDRFPSRYGRRRHWIVLSTPVLLISVFALFLPNRFFGMAVNEAFLLVWLIIMYVGWTMFNMSHLAWGAELATDYHEKTRIQGWREFFTLGGMILVLALPAIVAALGGNRTDQVAIMGLFVCLSMPFTVALSVRNVGERSTAQPERVNWKLVARSVIGNVPFLRILLGDFALGVSGGVTAGILLFVLNDVFGLGTMSSLLLLINISVGFFCIPIIIWLSKRLGKHQTMIASLVFDACTLPLLLLLPANNLPLAIALFALLGINRTAPQLCIRSITADIAHLDEARTGSGKTGAFFALIMMTQKTGAAFSLLLTYWLLEFVGYRPGAGNSPDSLAWLLSLYVFVPLTLNVVVAASFWRFPVGRSVIEALEH